MGYGNNDECSLDEDEHSTEECNPHFTASLNNNRRKILATKKKILMQRQK